MAKDKLVGGGILVAAILILVFYTYWLWFDYARYVGITTEAGWLQGIAAAMGGISLPVLLPALGIFTWELAVIIPIYLAILLVLIIAIWIGYSMATTPPPVPLEELEEELEAEEAAAEAAAKEK